MDDGDLVGGGGGYEYEGKHELLLVERRDGWGEAVGSGAGPGGRRRLGDYEYADADAGSARKSVGDGDEVRHGVNHAASAAGAPPGTPRDRATSR